VRKGRGRAVLDLETHFERKVVIGHQGGHWSVDAKINNKGYHVISIGDARTDYAHRVAHRLYIGPIPVHLEVDHKCRVKWCCNPAHLEAVTHAENLRRAYPTCRRGHDFETLSSGRRWCPECQRIRRSK
jgi:hypothetical protein